jgi:hypothetical protein
MSTEMVVLWLIGAAFTTGICYDFGHKNKHRTKWYFWIASPVACLLTWPLLLGLFVGAKLQ